jgi:tetratricopeptide (TPR) repeat protein
MGTREKIAIVLVTIVAIMAIPELIQASNQRISWDKYSTEGRRLLLFGDKEKAVEFYKADVSKVIQTEGVRSPAYIASLEGLAMAYQRLDMFVSAEDQYKEALKQLNKAYIPDRTRIRETMGLLGQMYEKRGEKDKLKELHAQEQRLNPWWQWFCSCFIVTFAAEALYMAIVLGRPDEIEFSHFKVQNGCLFAFASLVGTVGMFRGLILSGADPLQSFFWALGITLALFPFVFGAVLVVARNFGQPEANKHIEVPSASKKGSSTAPSFHSI